MAHFNSFLFHNQKNRASLSQYAKSNNISDIRNFAPQAKITNYYARKWAHGRTGLCGKPWRMHREWVCAAEFNWEGNYFRILILDAGRDGQAGFFF
jgi:hypothetical protein